MNHLIFARGQDDVERGLCLGERGGCRVDSVRRGLLERSLIEVQNAARLKKDVARIVAGIELERLVEIRFGVRQRVQLFVGKV